MKSKLLGRHYIVLMGALLLITFTTKAQTAWDTLPWHNYADYKLQFLNKDSIPTGILYDRMFPIANVDEFTGDTTLCS